MKLRTDYVTNSSSSSFVLAFNSKEDGVLQISALMQQYDSNCITTLLSDFIDAVPISPDDFTETVKDDVESIALYDMSMGEGCWWSASKPTFRNLWYKNHPGAKWEDYYNSPEYKDELARRTAEIMDELNSKIADLPYIVMLDYEDHSGIGSALEHEILPNCDFTIRRFNNH